MDDMLLDLMNWNRVNFVVNNRQSMNLMMNYWNCNLMNYGSVDDLMTTVVDNLTVLRDGSLGWDSGVSVDWGVDDWDYGMDDVSAAVVDQLA